MKSLPLVVCALTLLATALPVAHDARAGVGIQRCESKNGQVVYTDRACATLGARAVPMSGELLTRIASERSRDTAPDEIDALSLNAPLPTPGRRSPMDGCAKTTTQLAMDLQGSFALGDINRVAESYHWVGQSHQQAQPLLARLDRLSRQPLQDIEYFDAQIGPAGMQLADASEAAYDGGMAGIMQLTLGRGSGIEVVDLRVRRYAGCYFVQF